MQEGEVVDKFKFPKIGMRNIKTGLSVFLTLLVSYAIGRKDPFFGCIAAVICLQQTKEATWSLGIQRFIGTAIGGIVGFVVMESLAYFENYEVIRLIIIPIGVCVLIYLCVLFKIRGAASISCIVFINVVLHMDRTLDDSAMYVIDRVIDTLIGIVCAGVVQHLHFYYKNRIEDTNP